MLLRKEVYARKRIHNGCSVQIENFSLPRDGIFNPHLTTIKDSYNPELCGDEPCYKEVGAYFP